MRSNTGRTHTGPIILDTNLVVYAFADVSYFSRIEPSEQAKARICVSVLYLSRCEVIIPSIIAEVEVRRVVSKMIITKSVTNPDKLKMLVNNLKYVNKVLDRLKKLGKCGVVETWDIEVLRRAAGLYNRLVRAGLGNWAQRRHQDLIILATAELHGAGILTADHDFLQLIEKTGSKASLHLFTIDEKGRISIEKKNVNAIPCVDSIVNTWRSSEHTQGHYHSSRRI